MNNSKIIAAIAAATLLAGISSSYAATNTIEQGSSDAQYEKMDRKKGMRFQLTDEQKETLRELKPLLDKKRSGETLTADETAKLEAFKSELPQRPGKGFAKHGPKGHMMEKLTEAEKTQLESMSEEEKREFFETKREEHKAKREARETVIDKLLAGETLTAEEEVLRAGIIKERAERKLKMQEMEEKREKMKAIFDKKKAGETLTNEEQTILDEMKQRKGEKMNGKKGKRAFRGMGEIVFKNNSLSIL